MRKTWICKRNGRKQPFVSAFPPFPWLIRSCAQEHCGSSPRRLSVVARHVGFRVPTHGGRASASPERHRQETVACRAACPRTCGCDIFGIARWRSFPSFCYLCNPNNYINHRFRKKNETYIIASCGRNGKPLRRAEAARRTGTQR